MSVGDYGRQILNKGKQELKNQIMKKLLPILIKYVAPVVLVLIILLSIIMGVMGGTSASAANGYTDINGVICGGTIEEKIWFSLRNAGYSEIAVAGAMGNIYAESGYNSSAIEIGYTFENGGIGLCQWTNYPRNSTSPDARKNRLINYANSKGVEWQDENTQIEYLLGEVNKSRWS